MLLFSYKIYSRPQNEENNAELDNIQQENLYQHNMLKL